MATPVENMVISLYAKGMSVSDIEQELQEIYGYKLSTSAISIITDKITGIRLAEQTFRAGLLCGVDGWYRF